jgi:hypothetical protein
MLRTLALPTFLALVLLGGCLGSEDGTEAADGPEPGQEAWHASGPSAPLVIGPEVLGQDDWVVVEIRAPEPQLITLKADIELDFTNPAVSPALTAACPVYAVGIPGLEADFVLEPFFVPERSYPGAVEVGPQPELVVASGDVVVDERVRTTGFHWTDGGTFTTPIGTRHGPTYVAFGLADRAAWMATGATFALRVGEGEVFEHRVVHRGQATCITDLSRYGAGTVVRGAQATAAEGVATEVPVAQGLVAVVTYAADLERSMRLEAPDGTLAVEDGYMATGGTPAASARTMVHCSGQAGPWTLSFPVLRGTDHRLVYANSLLLDVPLPLHAAFPC